MLNARKLSIAKILVFLFKNTISDPKNSINCRKIKAEIDGIRRTRIFKNAF